MAYIVMNLTERVEKQGGNLFMIGYTAIVPTPVKSYVCQYEFYPLVVNVPEDGLTSMCYSLSEQKTNVSPAFYAFVLKWFVDEPSGPSGRRSTPVSVA